MRYAIRHAVDTDVPGIVTVESAAGRISATQVEAFAERIEDAIADPDRMVLVAEGSVGLHAEAGSGVGHASLALHRTWGFQEVARGAAFHAVTFDGGEGVLLMAARPSG